MRKNLATIAGRCFLMSGIVLLLVFSNPTAGFREGNQIRQDQRFRFISAKDTSLVVWVKPGASFTNWKTRIQARFSQRMDVKSKCSDCDINLLLLTGPAIRSFISGETATGGNGNPGKTGASGDDGEVIYSVNYPIEFTDTIRKYDNMDIPPFVPKSPSLNPVTVGVFDTGVDPDPKLSGLFYNNPVPSCFGTSANNGWNFTVPDKFYMDNHHSKHGTVVSAFVAEQIYKYGKNSVRILPVKTHDSTGRSDLFSILCGMSYAVNRGAKIINASFGFYAPRYLSPSTVPDSSAYLLKKYIQTYLLPKNILLVAAAGNRDDIHEDVVYHPADRTLQRNLENVSFYPASFARDLRNVFAVTTVNHANLVSPNQNYSPFVVDIGVYADRASDFAFANPTRPGQSVVGSSFATPVVTGKLCANYALIAGMVASGVYTKDAILHAMGASVVHSEPTLSGKVHNGMVMSR